MKIIVGSDLKARGRSKNRERADAENGKKKEITEIRSSGVRSSATLLLHGALFKELRDFGAGI